MNAIETQKAVYSSGGKVKAEVCAHINILVGI